MSNSHSFISPTRPHLRSSSNSNLNQTPPFLQSSYLDNNNNLNQSYNNNNNNSVLDWAAWTQSGMSPEINLQNNQNQNNHNNLLNSSTQSQEDSDISMDNNTFMDPFNTNSIHEHDYSELGMDVDGDRSLDRLQMGDDVDAERRKNNSSVTKRARTRLQSRTTLSPSSTHPYIHSSPLSPNASRFYPKEQPLELSPVTTNYNTVYPSPFRQNSSSSSATMDPTNSVRSISPSEVGSISGLGHSRMGSVSGASSVFDGDYGSVSEFGASIRSQSESPQKARRPTISRRDSLSPKKPKRPGKLTNAERKKICLHREAFPETRQDTIGDKFGVERSTISKILKNKERWLALPSDDEDEISPVQPSPATSPLKASKSALYPTINLFNPSVSVSSPAEPGRPRGGTRYPELDQKLTDWVRTYIGSGESLSDELLLTQAKDLAKSIPGCEVFKASPAWMERFKSRVGIVDGLLVGEESSSNVLGASIRSSLSAATLSEASSPRDSKRKRHSSAGITRRPLSMSLSTSPLPTTLEVEVHTPPRETHLDTESTPTKSRNGLRSHQATLAQDFDHENDLVSSLRSAQTPPTRRQNSLSQSHSQGSLSVNSYQAVDGSPSHYPFSYSSDRGSQSSTSSYTFQEPLYPLQSPFQATAQSFFPHHATTGSSSTSGANSPGVSLQHNRTGSTASTTSSYSGLTAFSSQNGPGTPLSGSHYGSFSTAQSSSTSGSLPSTPATGYFGHGPNGTQSQLQAVFVQEQYSFPGFTQTQPTPPLGRRATISGTTPYNSGGSTPSPATKLNQANLQQSTSTSGTSTASSTNGSEVSFDQAYASLQTALEYLSTNGNGFVSAVDLVVLSDLRAKMATSSSPTPQLAASPSFNFNSTTTNSIAELRSKMERTNSVNGNLSTSSIRTRGQLGNSVGR